ncbi:MAG: hypothetical protein F6K30_05110 [Cyanothece sp. SIO2G6]|nr:hypothetical protein [Cyanothece sp. SIO2G6]
MGKPVSEPLGRQPVEPWGRISLRLELRSPLSMIVSTFVIEQFTCSKPAHGSVQELSWAIAHLNLT